MSGNITERTERTKNILICSNKGISSKFVFNTLHDIAIQYYKELKEKDPECNVIFLTQYSSKKNVISLFDRNNKEYFFDDVIVYRDFFKDTDYTLKADWLDVYETLDISAFPEIDEVIEIGSALSEVAKIQNGYMNYDLLFKNKNQFKYLSIRTNKEYIMLILKILRRDKCRLNHYIIDPQEFNYNDVVKDIDYKRFFGYTSKSIDFERNDNFLKSFIQNTESRENIYDFTFGYTVLTKSRSDFDIDYLISELNKNKLNSNFYIKDKFKDIDSFITKDEYLEKIKESKYTLIIPSYDKRTFSIFRYQESIMNGCIPLILDTCFLDEVKNDFDIPINIICNINNISEKIRDINYEETIIKLKEDLCKK